MRDKKYSTLYWAQVVKPFLKHPVDLHEDNQGEKPQKMKEIGEKMKESGAKMIHKSSNK